MRVKAPAGIGSVAVAGDVASSTESVSDPAGPAEFRFGAKGTRAAAEAGMGPNAIAFNCESGRNCRTNYATPKVAKNFLANDQNVEKGSSSSRSGKPGGKTGGKLLSQLFEMISI